MSVRGSQCSLSSGPEGLNASSESVACWKQRLKETRRGGRESGVGGRGGEVREARKVAEKMTEEEEGREEHRWRPM